MVRYAVGGLPTMGAGRALVCAHVLCYVQGGSMKEIGGYFEMERLPSHPYHAGCAELNTACAALLCAAKVLDVKSLRLPRFLCDSVTNACDRAGIHYTQYDIDSHFLPCAQEPLGAGEYLYVVNYYGLLDNEAIGSLVRQWERVIVDNVHAFFQLPALGEPTIYSCRKFFGVPDGAYLRMTEDASAALPVETESAVDRLRHIIGRAESGGNPYFKDYHKNEESLCASPARRMSLYTRTVMGAADYDSVIAARSRNYDVLAARLGESNELEVKKPFVPFAYPYRSRNATAMRAQLARRGVYVSTLWGNCLSVKDDSAAAGCRAAELAESIMPLPLDQRYTAEDMERVASEVLRVREEIGGAA